ncbi:MAG TPA: hypothetical protein VF080_06115 [Solirubrobacteraceae bacterium]
MGNDRPRRGLWMFRALLGLLAVGLLAVVVQRAAGHSADADWLRLTAEQGQTAQGAVIEMRFDGEEHPLAFGVRVHARCTGGSSWNARWSPFDGSAVTFRRDGRGLRVVEISDRRYDDGSFGQVVFSMRATLGPGARQARGWVRMTAVLSHAGGAGTACDSGRVPFAIDAPLAVGATSARPS